MASNPLVQDKAALKEAYKARKEWLVNGSGEYQSRWNPTGPVKDPSEANSKAGDSLGPIVAEAKKLMEMIPVHRQANMLLVLARDEELMRRSRLERGGEYAKMLEREYVDLDFRVTQ